MKFSIVVMFISLMFLFGCNDKEDVVTNPTPVSVPTVSISLACIDHVSMGGRLNRAIRTQAEYDYLIYQYYQKPLNDYWNANYQSVLQTIKEEYPGLTDLEYAVLVNKAFYTSLPFEGTENCSFPSIDFSQNSLLVQSVKTGGCRFPDLTPNVTWDDTKKEVHYSLKVTTHGNCMMLIFRRKWLLVPRIPDSYNVIFTQDEEEGPK